MPKIKGKFDKEINWELVEWYVQSNCSQQEIAECFRVTAETLRERVKEHYGVDYSVFSSALRSEGGMGIKATQHYVAIKKKNVQMLIHLGKTRLGQKEPESNTEYPLQSLVNLQNENMRLKHELSKYESANNLQNQPKTEPEFYGVQQED